MQITSLKWAKVITLLLVGIYLFTGIVLVLHHHKDGIYHEFCSICYSYLNYHSQDLPSQPSTSEFVLLQTICLLESMVYSPKIVFLNDSTRAPPQLQTL